MAASISKQYSAMDSLAWRIGHEWNRAKNVRKTMDQMQTVWNDLVQSAEYQCLAGKRRETIFFHWHYTRTYMLSQNQVQGRWCNGCFFHSWCDLPEEYKASDSLLKTLPSGHFWLNGDGQATPSRYFVSSDCANEDERHFTGRPTLANV
jgi:hypothetical protein